MSNILKCLKIHNFETLYLRSKLSFLESIKKNELSSQVFNILCEDLNETLNNSKSFQKDMILLEENFGIDIGLIFCGPIRLRNSLNSTFYESDGLKDSIMFCLNKINNKFYRNILNNLINNNFM